LEELIECKFIDILLEKLDYCFYSGQILTPKDMLSGFQNTGLIRLSSSLSIPAAVDGV
jgi:hypothetical protein